MLTRVSSPTTTPLRVQGSILSSAALPLAAQDKAMLDLALEPPLINTKPGPEYDEQVRPGNEVGPDEGRFQGGLPSEGRYR